MRSNTWERYDSMVRNSDFLSKEWFSGEHFNRKTYTNIPDLSTLEIDAILKNIGNIPSINEELYHEFRTPLNISIYHQILEEKSYLEDLPEINANDLTAQYVRNKIYRSNYYTEKIHFLRKLIHLTNFGKDGFCARKDMLINDLSAFKNAYSELLSDGILSENFCESCASDMQTVCFSHTKVFDYFLQIELLLLSKG